MSTTAKAVSIADNDLKRHYPDLTPEQRATLAADFVNRGWVHVTGETAVYSEAVRAVLTKMPQASNFAVDASTRMLAAERDSIRGNDDKSKTRRAILNAEIARLRGSVANGPQISDDLQADLAAVRGNDEMSKAKRAGIRQAHARVNLRKRDGQ